MPQRISILSEAITNRIAAGEVVERPASVIKELLENAIDAGATDITIEISQGGRSLIRVTDNGWGMSREDALLSLERHATSKIKTDQDLGEILTLGFRGEALPSIASVSRFRLSTREAGALEGTEVVVEGGKVRDVRACGMPTGTAITVENLFFNTPVRLKFLRSPETEAGHVADTVIRVAVSRPDIAFTCISDGRELLRTQRGTLLRRLEQVLGKQTGGGLHDVTSVGEGLSLTGYLGAPTLALSTPRALFTYINGRFIRDKVVQHALMQAYRGVIDRGRYPVLALFITMPPGEVDVNVHPTKHEVRFRRQTVVHDAIQDAVAQSLKASPWLASAPARTSPVAATGAAYRERIAAAAQASLTLSTSTSRPAGQPAQTSSIPRPDTPVAVAPPADRVGEVSPPFSAAEPARESGGYFAELDIIGQFHGEYLLCQRGEQLVIIDQHAASERVAFERLRQQYRTGGIESQRLLFPETLELSFSEAAAVMRHREDLSRIGFELEPFGGSTVLVSAIPRLLGEQNPLALVRDMAGELATLGASALFQERVEELLARIACHSVVRGVHPLDRPHSKELLRAMDDTDFAASCPHGRPVSHIITLTQLEKIFKRI